MPVTYSLDAPNGILRTVCAGQVRLAEVLAHIEEIGKDRSLPASLDLLLDLATSETAPDGDQVRLVAQRFAATRADIDWGRCAIVVSRDVLFGLSRMFEVHTDGTFSTTRIFRDGDEARAWLATPATAG